MSAIDIALWDLKGKCFGEPVWRLLGGNRDSVPAYITFGLAEFETEQLTDTARRLESEGHQRLKMVVAGRGDSTPAGDAKRVRAVREAVGDDVRLAIDANYGYSINEAVELCRRVECLDISWFEEPVYGNDAPLLSNLRKRTEIPIAAGQNEGDVYGHRRLVESEAVDIALPNVCFVGGFTAGVKAAALADAHNLVAGHGGGWPVPNLHFQAGISNGWRVEYHYLHWLMGQKMYESIPEVLEGSVTLPFDPGLGLEPDWSYLERHEID